MESSKRWDLQYEVDSIKRQLTTHFPISEPTIRQTLLRILTITEHVLDDIDKDYKGYTNAE